MTSIVQNGNEVLRAVAKAVAIEDITTPTIRKVIADMQAALHGEYDGVAIAAPQIGVSLRIFVVSGKIFDEDFKRGEMKAKKKSTTPDLVFINPEFTKISKKKKWLSEGCLSVRWLYGEVERSVKASVRAYDEHGKKFERGGSDLLAHIFQHEIDHLDGVLFIDKARNVEEQTKEEVEKRFKEKE
jgi:peptide deformylase